MNMSVFETLLAIPRASAQEIKLDNPLPSSDLVTILNNAFTQGLKFLAPIVAIIIIVGAFQMIFAQGEPEKFAKGQKTIVYSVIGFAIVLMAKGIIAIVQRLLS